MLLELPGQCYASGTDDRGVVEIMVVAIFACFAKWYGFVALTE
jgi:hypothetical protein